MSRRFALQFASLLLAGCTLFAKPRPAPAPFPVVPPTDSPAAEGTLTLSPAVTLTYTLWRAAEPGAPTTLRITDAAGAKLLERTNVMELVGLRDVGAPTPVILVQVKSNRSIGDFYEAYLYEPTGLRIVTWERDPYIASLRDPEQADESLVTITHEPVLGGGWQEVRRTWAYAGGALRAKSQGPQLCDSARYPNHPFFLFKALGGGEIRQGPFTFCLYLYPDTLMLGDKGESRYAYLTDLPGLAWAALWRYDGAPIPGRTTRYGGALPEGLVPGLDFRLQPGQTGGLEGDGVAISAFPLPDGRRQLGIRLRTPDGSYGARLLFRVVDGSVADVSVAPWDEGAAWPAFVTAVGPAGVTAVGLDDQLTLVDQAGRITQVRELASPISSLLWSPSGRRLLLQTKDDRLWLLTAGGGIEPVNMGIPPVPFMIAWSPDEQRLLLGERSGQTCTIWLYSLADGTRQELATYERLLGLFWPDPGHAIVQGYTGDRFPVTQRYTIAPWQRTAQASGQGTIAPNGKTMVITSPRGTSSLTIANLVTGEAQTIWESTPAGAPEGAYRLDQVSFSPDSRRIAYTAIHAENGAAMLRMASVDGQDQLVTDRPAGAMAWAPGGGLLYAERSAGGRVTVKLDHRSLGSIEGSQVGAAVWSADGRRAALAVDGPDNTRRLVVVQPEPAVITEVPNSQQLTPLMWAGDRLLAAEEFYVHHFDKSGWVPRALWLIKPDTGERTPVLP